MYYFIHIYNNDFLFIFFPNVFPIFGILFSCFCREGNDMEVVRDWTEWNNMQLPTGRSQGFIQGKINCCNDTCRRSISKFIISRYRDIILTNHN
jgi:hypothetical protein